MLVQAVLIGFIAMFVTFEWMLGTNLVASHYHRGAGGACDGGFKDRNHPWRHP